MNKEVFKREYLPISKLVPNTGQIEGVPKNPRFIRDDNFRALVADMEKDPEMLELKEPWVIPFEGKYVVFAGNMRFRAAKDLKRKEMPCKIVPEDSAPAQLRGWIIKDNVERGEWDQDLLANEWDEDNDLEEWGVKVPVWDDSELAVSDIDYSDKNKELDIDGFEDKAVIKLEYSLEEYEQVKTSLSRIAETPAQAVWSLLKL